MFFFQVTYLSGYEKSSSHPNIKVVVVPDVNILNKMPNIFTTNMFTVLGAMYNDLKKACIKALEYEEVQRLNNEKFDLLILYTDLTECFLSFAHKQKVCSFHGKHVASLVTCVTRISDKDDDTTIIFSFSFYVRVGKLAKGN